jgi:transcriptional regulator with XRE-family HTH domain
MKNTELNILMGLNLRKLRMQSKLTQERLAERLQVSNGLIPKWEAGRKGIGKNVLLKLCKVFNVRPYVFFVDERAPYIACSREQVVVAKIREAERLGIADVIEQFSDFMVVYAKKKSTVGSAGTKDHKGRCHDR